MNVSAIIVASERPSTTEAAAEFAHYEQNEPLRKSIIYADVLGQSVLDRTVARLRNAGIRTISVIGGPTLASLPSNRDVEIIVAGSTFARWPAALRTLKEQSAQGIETVLMIGLGAYMELKVADNLEFHRTRGLPLTQLEDSQGPLDCWIVDSHWFSAAATGCTLPFRYGEFPGLPTPCPMNGYVNRLADARDLRRLVLDAFLWRCEIRPAGREARPGIWVDDGAQVHKSCRLVAPVYLGRSTKVGPSAVITRFSNMERNCQVGAGTVVEGASILPHTLLGSGLEVSHAVVDGNRYVDLDRNLAVQINDRHWIRDATPLKRRVPAYYREPAEQLGRRKDPVELAYSQRLSRVAGSLAQAFRSQI